MNPISDEQYLKEAIRMFLNVRGITKMRILYAASQRGTTNDGVSIKLSDAKVYTLKIPGTFDFASITKVLKEFS